MNNGILKNFPCNISTCRATYVALQPRPCKDGLARCPDCLKKYQTEQRQRRHTREYTHNHKEALEKLRDSSDYIKYGFLPGERAERTQAQKGVCKICKRIPENGRTLHIDHNHKTGLTRDLLCNKCNSCLAMVDENPIWLMEATKYLIKWTEIHARAAEKEIVPLS